MTISQATRLDEHVFDAQDAVRALCHTADDVHAPLEFRDHLRAVQRELTRAIARLPGAEQGDYD